MYQVFSEWTERLRKNVNKSYMSDIFPAALRRTLALGGVVYMMDFGVKGAFLSISHLHATFIAIGPKFAKLAF